MQMKSSSFVLRLNKTRIEERMISDSNGEIARERPLFSWYCIVLLSSVIILSILYSFHYCDDY